jgi:hypothetical protein
MMGQSGVVEPALDAHEDERRPAPAAPRWVVVVAVGLVLLVAVLAGCGLRLQWRVASQDATLARLEARLAELETVIATPAPVIEPKRDELLYRQVSGLDDRLGVLERGRIPAIEFELGRLDTAAAGVTGSQEWRSCLQGLVNQLNNDLFRRGQAAYYVPC